MPRVHRCRHERRHGTQECVGHAAAFSEKLRPIKLRYYWRAAEASYNFLPALMSEPGSRPTPRPYVLPEKAPGAPGQLYNLESDPGETTNLYFEHPEIVKQLKTQLDEFVSSGRGAPTRNVPAQ